MFPGQQSGMGSFGLGNMGGMQSMSGFAPQVSGVQQQAFSAPVAAPQYVSIS
jgi:hypothetical protein